MGADCFVSNYVLGLESVQNKSTLKLIFSIIQATNNVYIGGCFASFSFIQIKDYIDEWVRCLFYKLCMTQCCLFWCNSETTECIEDMSQFIYF